MEGEVRRVRPTTGTCPYEKRTNELACEDTAGSCRLQGRMWVYQQLNKPAPQTWTSSLQNCEKQFKLPPAVAPGQTEAAILSLSPLYKLAVQKLPSRRQPGVPVLAKG